MTRRLYAQKVFGCLLCLFLLAVACPAQEEKKDILIGAKLVKGFDMGIDSSEKERTWLKGELGYMKMSFPPYQEWAALFITVGKAVDPPRNKWVDFSAYKTLSIDLKGEKGGELIEVGMKTNIQPDDGTETKITIELTSDWKTYTFPLNRFTGTDLTHLYVVTEFVYNGQTPQTVYFRDIKVLK